jgi:hypothetical protein
MIDCVRSVWGKSMIEATASIFKKHSGPCVINDFVKNGKKQQCVLKQNIAGHVELAHISKHCAALLKSLKKQRKTYAGTTAGHVGIKHLSSISLENIAGHVTWTTSRL